MKRFSDYDFHQALRQLVPETSMSRDVSPLESLPNELLLKILAYLQPRFVWRVVRQVKIVVSQFLLKKRFVKNS